MNEEQAYAHTYKRVLEFFKGNVEKTSAWFNSPNPLLGSIVPNDMVKLGRAYKLKSFVDSLLEYPK